MLEKKVYVIEPENPIFNTMDNQFIKTKKLKVCAYARVSSDTEDQLNSYNAQIQEFEKRIKEKEEWEFIGLYADEGLSGTGMKKRTQFLKMIQDAKLGKIDLILTKSLSRFARNTIDTLTIVRELRELGVDIFFEKENIYSSDSKVDFMLTIFSSIAQEESRNISENVKWGIQKRYREGRVIINTNRFLGYDKDENGKLIINEEQGRTVKIIFDMYIFGSTLSEIARFLTKQEHKNGRGVVSWTAATIKVILKNEKYCGDAILQKRVTIDYLTHKSVWNDGIVPKYYIKDNHEGIVTRETFELVQNLIKKRKENRNKSESKFASKYPLSGIVFCSHCGHKMNRHHYNYGKKNQRVVLSCKNRGQGKPKNHCKAKPMDNNDLEKVIAKSIESKIDRNKLNNDLYRAIENNLCTKEYTDEIEKVNQSILKLQEEINEIMSMDITSLKENTFFFEELYKSKKKQLEVLQTDLETKKHNLATKHVHKERMEEIKSFIENKTGLSRRILKTEYTYFIIINPNELLFVKDGNIAPKEISDILMDKILSSTNKTTHSININLDPITYTIVNLEDNNEQC